MSLHPIEVKEQPSRREAVRLFPRPYGRSRYFAAALICCAVLIAGFGMTEIWQSGGFAHLGTQNGDGQEGTTESDGEVPPADMQEPPQSETESLITTRDLSYVERGSLYINNVTSYTVDASALLNVDVSSTRTNEPLVLILHTHTSEGYWSGQSVESLEQLGAATYTREEENSVIAVGCVLSETLQKNGITAIHCTVMHDDPTLGGSYERAAESIRFYLEQYPSIRYVIDLHRDAVTTDDEAYVRAVTEVDGEAVAQVMCVVGSEGNGFACKNWQDNLSLALQLRARLNAEEGRVCRPVYLRNATYNQELAPYSLLLEIGTGANGVTEAKRAAVLVGEALAELIYP